MADRPFSLFVNPETLTPGEQAEIAARSPSILEASGLTFYADLYRALASVLSPREVDELELWQIGALLGIDRKPQPYDPLAALAAGMEPGVGPVDMTAQIARSMGIDFGR